MYAVKEDTLDEVLKFLKEEIIFCFGPRRTIISDNKRYPSANKIQSFMKENNNNVKQSWNTPQC